MDEDRKKAIEEEYQKLSQNKFNQKASNWKGPNWELIILLTWIAAIVGFFPIRLVGDNVGEPYHLTILYGAVVLLIALTFLWINKSRPARAKFWTIALIVLSFALVAGEIYYASDKSQILSSTTASVSFTHSGEMHVTRKSSNSVDFQMNSCRDLGFNGNIAITVGLVPYDETGFGISETPGSTEDLIQHLRSRSSSGVVHSVEVVTIGGQEYFKADTVSSGFPNTKGSLLGMYYLFGDSQYVKVTARPDKCDQEYLEEEMIEQILESISTSGTF